MATCTVADCGTQVHARGWCKLHYKRWERTGDPTIVLIPGGLRLPPAPILERFPNATRRTIAEAVGVSARTVARWQHGGNVASPDRIAVAIGHHPAELWPQEWSV